MYWDNDKIANSYFASSARKERDFADIQRRYMNDELFIIDATWNFDDRTFRKDGEFKKVVQKIIANLDGAVWDANRTIDSNMEIDDDYKLSMIEEDDFIKVVGMTTDEGAVLIENCFLSASNYGEVSFIISA